MIVYTETLIVSEFRAGKTIDGIANNMLLAKKEMGLNQLNGNANKRLKRLF